MSRLVLAVKGFFSDWVNSYVTVDTPKEKPIERDTCYCPVCGRGGARYITKEDLDQRRSALKAEYKRMS